MDKISEGVEDPFDISRLERELANCGLSVIEHVITPRDLALLRQNFLAKNKKPVFTKARAVLKAGEYIRGAWDSPLENQLFGLEVSTDDIEAVHLAMPTPRD